MIAHVDDKEILTVNAALGSRDSDITGVWVEPPDVPPPLECPPHDHWRGDAGGLHGQIEMRMAKGNFGFDMKVLELHPARRTGHAGDRRARRMDRHQGRFQIRAER